MPMLLRMFKRLIFLMMAAILLSSCAVPPAETIQSAKESGRKAFAAKAKTHAPREYREYEYAVARARRFQMEEDVRLIPMFRDYSRVVEAYSLARNRGEEARQAALKRQAELTAEAQSDMLQADQELTEVRDLVTGVPVGRLSGQILSEAEMLVSEAALLIELGEYEKAKAAAANALEKVSTVANRAGFVLDRYMRPELLDKWRRWARETVEWSRQNSSHAFVVDKSRHTCTVYYAGKEKESFRVNLGLNGLNQKYRAGDLATPEGRYYIVRKQDAGQSRFYKSLLLNYPNEEDWQRFNQAKRESFISSASRIGGLIMIHGEGRRNVDWTQGCVALVNRDMDTLFSWAEVDTPVTIVGRDNSSKVEADDVNDVISKTQEKIARKNGAKGQANKEPGTAGKEHRATTGGL